MSRNVEIKTPVNRVLPAGRVVVLAVGLVSAACGGGSGMKSDGQPVPVLNIAHRGASAHAPEHTLAAWDLALEMGADYLEQDLQMTADGVLVVLHDETLDRTARGPAARCTGRVGDRTLEEIRQCDVGSWFNEEHPERADESFADLRIPTLQEVLERYAGRARFYIETKNPAEAPGMEEALVRLLDEHGLLDAEPGTVLLQSFSPESLATLATLAPALPRVQLIPGRETSASIRESLQQIAGYAQGIGPSHRSVDRQLVEAAHELGLVVHPYTVDVPSRMRELLAAGVDGMFTNAPDALATVIGESRP